MQTAFTRRGLLTAGAALGSLGLGWTGRGHAAPSDVDALIAGAKKEGKLVYYTTGQQDAVQQLLGKFADRYPFIDVGEYYRNTSGRVVARLQSESDAGLHVCDVLNTASAAVFLGLKAAGKLARFHPAEQDSYPPALRDPGFWTIFSGQAITLGYNDTILPADAVPTSWEALTDPRFKGKVGFEDSTSGSQHMQWYVLREVMGPEFWKRVKDNEPRPFAGTTPIVEAVLRGELLLAGECYSYHGVLWAQRDAPFRVIFPKEGVPFSFQFAAVLTEAPHPNAARLFVQWLLSPEGEQAMVTASAGYSVREAESAPSPPIVPGYGQLKKLLPSSFQGLVDSQPEFVSEWRQIVGR